MKTRLFLLVLLSACGVATGRAQLYVDYGGPRNIFVVPAGASAKSAPAADKGAAAASTDKTATAGAADKGAAAATADDQSKDFFAFDSKKGAATLNFLNLGMAGSWAFGGTLTATAPDNDLKQLLKFKQAPTVEGAVLANWTDYSGRSRTHTWSVTARAANAYSSYDVQDPVTAKTATTKFNQPQGSLAWALAFSDDDSGYLRNAFALTLGVSRDTNFDSLPQVTLANGKTAHSGVLQKFTAFPLQLTFVRDAHIDNEALKKIAGALAKLVTGKLGEDNWALMAPYVKATPRKGGATTTTYGFNLALLTLTPGAKPSDDKFAYPWSFYVETTKKPGSDHYTTTGGASVVFSL